MSSTKYTRTRRLVIDVATLQGKTIEDAAAGDHTHQEVYAPITHDAEWHGGPPPPDVEPPPPDQDIASFLRFYPEKVIKEDGVTTQYNPNPGVLQWVWEVPAGVTSIRISGTGAGGGGGSGVSDGDATSSGHGEDSAGGGGGGSGAYIVSKNHQVNPGDTVIITVGRGGAGGYEKWDSWPAYTGTNHPPPTTTDQSGQGDTDHNLGIDGEPGEATIITINSTAGGGTSTAGVLTFTNKAQITHPATYFVVWVVPNSQQLRLVGGGKESYYTTAPGPETFEIDLGGGYVPWVSGEPIPVSPGQNFSFNVKKIDGSGFVAQIVAPPEPNMGTGGDSISSLTSGAIISCSGTGFGANYTYSGVCVNYSSTGGTTITTTEYILPGGNGGKRGSDHSIEGDGGTGGNPNSTDISSGKRGGDGGNADRDQYINNVPRFAQPGETDNTSGNKGGDPGKDQPSDQPGNPTLSASYPIGGGGGAAGYFGKGGKGGDPIYEVNGQPYRLPMTAYGGKGESGAGGGGGGGNQLEILAEYLAYTNPGTYLGFAYTPGCVWPGGDGGDGFVRIDYIGTGDNSNVSTQ